jgi:hypothetical protein
MEGCVPTALPSPVPSPVPSALPSPVPSAIPTTSDCGIDVNINAVCKTACSFDNCVERPQRMRMFYRGGGCQNTSFRRCPLRNPDLTPELPNPDPCSCQREDLPCEQWNNKNTCIDYNRAGNECSSIVSLCASGQIGANAPPFNPACGPPNPNKEHSVWIEAFGKGEEYFAGKVDVNSTWDAVTVEEKVDANTDIFTYAYTGSGKGRLLQHVVFHSSCSQELYLSDQFGAQQLIEFESFCDVDRCDPFCVNGRRTISLFRDALGDFDFTLVARTSNQAPVTLRFVAALLSPQTFEFPYFGETQFEEFPELNGTSVPPSQIVRPNFNIRLDEEYQISGLVSGERNGVACDALGTSTLTCVRVPECDFKPNDCPCDPNDGGGGKNKNKDKKKTDGLGEDDDLLRSIARFFGP